jgi:hypothetical protein
MKNETFSHDGFPVCNLEFAIPPDTMGLDPETKRNVTICNLFINHKLTVRDIIRLLDEDYRHVVTALLNSGIVRERRQNRDVSPPEGIERRRIRNMPKHSHPRVWPSQ